MHIRPPDRPAAASGCRRHASHWPPAATPPPITATPTLMNIALTPVHANFGLRRHHAACQAALFRCAAGLIYSATLPVRHLVLRIDARFPQHP